MATTLPEAVRPSQQDIKAPVVTPEEQQRQMVVGVVQNLQPQHPVTIETVTPVTTQTPIPQTPELQQVGATVVGDHHEFTLNEELDSKKRDLSHLVKSFLASISGGHTEKREGPIGKLWNKIKGAKIKKTIAGSEKGANVSEDIE